MAFWNYVLQTRSRDPIILYTGRTENWARREKQHLNGEIQCTRQYGVLKLLRLQKCLNAPFAESREHHWAHILPYICHPWHVSNGITRWAKYDGEQYKLESDLAFSTETGGFSWKYHAAWSFDHDYPVPRDLEKQRQEWMWSFEHPIKVYDFNEIELKRIKSGTQLEFDFRPRFTLIS